jgi:erythronate-4-phosphate dehydrogenase
MIVVVNHIPGLGDALREFDDVTEVPYDAISNEYLRAVQCTALFVRSTTRVDAALLSGTDVRFVGTASSGYDHLDTSYLQKQGIAWRAAAGCNAHAVAEYVLYAICDYLLHGSHQALPVIVANDTIAENNYNNSSNNTGALNTSSPLRLNRLRLGIIGYGHVGRAVARIVKDTGMQVLINDPPALQAGLLTQEEASRHCSTAQISSQCDIVSNHVPLSFEGEHATAHLLSNNFFNELRSPAAFIHASRGGVCNEHDLLECIASKNTSAYVDVWQGEPVFSPALASRVRVCTPHIAGHSMDAHYVAANMMLRAYESFAGVVSAAIIKAPPGPALRSVSSFSDLQTLHQELGAALNIGYLCNELRSYAPLPDNERRRSFLQLRMNYTSRREIISRD